MPSTSRSLKDRLDVYLGRSLVGVLVRGGGGDVSFTYDRDWQARADALPVSLSLPLQAKAHTGLAVAAYFDNLLPDSDAIRARIAMREGAASDRPFDLLAAIGRDCIGALRFLPPGADPGDPTRMEADEVSVAEIARRLRHLKSAPLGREQGDDDFRISIAGAQDKTAFLRLPSGAWAIPRGATPTSHIFKPPIGLTEGRVDLSDSVENEWLCLALCRALGLPVANAAIERFEDVTVLVVERFDRRPVEGVLYRLPQEDLCQALGVPSSQKYEDRGGPGIAQILKLLARSDTPDQDRRNFLKAQMVFWLLSAPDGHAKNFSIFLTPGGFRLTPLYDVMSAIPYGATSRAFDPARVKLAMAVGRNRHYRVRDIALRHWRQTAEAAGLAEGVVEEIIAELRADLGATLRSLRPSLGDHVSADRVDRLFDHLAHSVKSLAVA
ncbi:MULTISPECIES: type II toxin-antitoxin system HipA family toxin [Nitrospirillum]|uniref:Serine/threonine-protein kinase HipA n=1 Tax=Nitrospirillum amazonense TaxID=28077 RepID=A0A560FJ15_9PROT|nr:type II toxin-antitoxin system HipA family toxin [Nitrospirillum amazonense]MEC4594204.1 type II toxin-antitoxin system HipA family toxin [Nitrospirillum amazonense]TWB21602.1 serine/threonine-protein kinase HipA [Nitrospirillum amazonense]